GEVPTICRRTRVRFPPSPLVKAPDPTRIRGFFSLPPPLPTDDCRQTATDEPSDSGAVTPSTGEVERPAEIANRRAASVCTDRSAEPDRPIGRGPTVPAPEGSCVTRSPCSEKDTA